MDDHIRRDVDEACLRLLGWQPDEWWPETQQWRAFPPGGHILMFCSPSRDDRFVVPLAEALRARGWCVVLSWPESGPCYAALTKRAEEGDATVCQEKRDRMEEALARAAARAVGTET